MSAGRIVVAGAVAQKPGAAGHTWQFLQYLLGLRRLGWDVLFVDRLHGEGAGDGPGPRWLADTLAAHGLGGAWTVRLDDGTHVGRSREDTLAFVRDSDLLVNVMGFLAEEDLLAAARRRVFLDTDPGFGQMWRALGLADVFAGHDAHVTIGERIGRDDCTVPTCGIDWITTPQPVVLDAFPATPVPAGAPLTSVASWRGAYGPIDFEGRRYGLRVHEFRRFADLPRLAGGDFTLALDIHEADAADAELLRAGGWALTTPRETAPTTGAYRDFIRGSAGEVMIAKEMYVASRSGWCSERSLCYLAAGRPVVAQDTGLRDLYPVGDGLLVFDTPDEAVAAVEAVRADPQRHGRAARELAETYFDSDVVLGRLLERLGAAVAR